MLIPISARPETISTPVHNATGTRSETSQAQTPEESATTPCERIVSGSSGIVGAGLEIAAIATAAEVAAPVAAIVATTKLAGAVGTLGSGVATAMSGDPSNADDFLSPGGLAGGVMGPAFGLSNQKGAAWGASFEQLGEMVDSLSDLVVGKMDWTSGIELVATRYMCGTPYGKQIENKLGPIADMFNSSKPDSSNSEHTGTSTPKESESNQSDTSSPDRSERGSHWDRTQHDSPSSDGAGDCSPGDDSCSAPDTQRNNDNNTDTGNSDGDSDTGGGDDDGGDSDSGGGDDDTGTDTGGGGTGGDGTLGPLG